MPNYNFPPTSRYYGVAGAVAASRRRPHGGLPVAPLRAASRAFSPVAPAHRHRGRAARHIAARELGDPEAFWRICDANGAMRPDELTAVPGRALRITLPQGIPGTTGSNPMLNGHPPHAADRAGGAGAGAEGGDGRAAQRAGDQRQAKAGLPAHLRRQQELAAADDAAAGRVFRPDHDARAARS